MRVAMMLGGSDLGKSGIGMYVKEVLPRLTELVHRDSGSLVAMGTPSELTAYRDILGGAETVACSYDRPGLSALWHLSRGSQAARDAHADILFLPAGNRRVVWNTPLPVVTVVHDLAQLHVPKKYDLARMTYIRHVLLPSLRRSNSLVAVSEATKRDLVQFLEMEPSRIAVVKNGVDCARFTPAQSDDLSVRRALKQSDLCRPYILYASRLEHPGKNHLRLLQGFKESGLQRTHTLVLVGKDWGAQELLESEVQRLGIENRVRFLGFVEGDILPGLVAGADAVVMVGLHEGFGLPALEAISAGVAVCASNTGSLPEVVSDYGILCDPYNPRSICEALKEVVENDQLRERTRTQGPVWAAQHSWEATAEGLYNALTIVSRRSS